MSHTGKSGSRMTTLSVTDLKKNEALAALRRLRRSYAHGSTHADKPIEDTDTLKRVLSFVGGRLSFLSKDAKQDDMLHAAEHMVAKEKGWLLSQIGLITDCDDDVMDEVHAYFIRYKILKKY